MLNITRAYILGPVSSDESTLTLRDAVHDAQIRGVNER
jgi:hypothetical protein